MWQAAQVARFAVTAVEAEKGAIHAHDGVRSTHEGLAVLDGKEFYGASFAKGFKCLTLNCMWRGPAGLRLMIDPTKGDQSVEGPRL